MVPNRDLNIGQTPKALAFLVDFWRAKLHPQEWGQLTQPIPNPWGWYIYPHFTMKINHSCLSKYTSPMNPMGYT